MIGTESRIRMSHVAQTRIRWLTPALVGVIALFGGFSPLHADELIPGNDYFSLQGGYVSPSKKYGTTGAGATVSALFGHQFAQRFSFEVIAQESTFEAGVNNGTDFYQYGVSGDLVYTFFDRRTDRWITPFMFIGAGAVDDDFHPTDRTLGFLAEGGVGAVTKPFFYDAIRFRLDARYAHDSKGGGHDEPRFVLGIEIPLGRSLRRVEYMPAKAEIHEVIKEREVIREKEIVRAVIDSDGDGVPDDIDQCPNTPKGMKVDATGCIVANQTLALQGVTFDSNKSRLTANAQVVLDSVSRAFLGQPTLKVDIAGHTDSIGSERANLMLSEQRAAAVREYLIQKGAMPAQLSAHGYGKSQLLIVPEITDGDRERNRRVELRVLAQ